MNAQPLIEAEVKRRRYTFGINDIPIPLRSIGLILLTEVGIGWRRTIKIQKNYCLYFIFRDLTPFTCFKLRVVFYGSLMTTIIMHQLLL